MADDREMTGSSSVLERLTRALRPPVQPDAQLRVIEVSTDSSVQDVYLDAATRFLDAQVKMNEVLDSRVGSAFAVGGTILPIAFGLLGVTDRALPLVSEVFLFLAVGAYVVLVGFAYSVANRIRAMEYRPNIPTLRQHTRALQREELLGWVASEYEASTEQNKEILSRKARHVGRVFAALYAESLCLSIAAVLSLVLA